MDARIFNWCCRMCIKSSLSCFIEVSIKTKKEAQFASYIVILKTFNKANITVDESEKATLQNGSCV